jgi:hypothetical protein
MRNLRRPVNMIKLKVFNASTFNARLTPEPCGTAISHPFTLIRPHVLTTFGVTQLAPEGT